VQIHVCMTISCIVGYIVVRVLLQGQEYNVFSVYCRGVIGWVTILTVLLISVVLTCGGGLKS